MRASLLPCVAAITAVGVFTSDSSVSAFSNLPIAKCLARVSPHNRPSLFMSTATDEDTTALTDSGLLKRDRYVATNRFSVRPGREA
eukprot:11939805-Ditylum_brightwellii.AAC.1